MRVQVLLSLLLLFKVSIASSSVCSAGCETGSCCEVNKGEFRCCPYENGVCCPDRQSCCPQGSSCDSQYGTCSLFLFSWQSKLLTVPKVEKIPVKVASNYTICPDQKSTCPNNNTCCAISSELWGCCALNQAVCCGDGSHCCPAGSVCNLQQGRCDIILHSGIVNSQANELPSLIFVSKLTSPQLSETSELRKKLMTANYNSLPSMAYKGQNCGNSSYKCPSNTTCCLGKYHRWSCCPLPKAVCCKGGLHCCPNGTVCNLRTMECDKFITRYNALVPHAPLASIKSFNPPNSNGVECGGGDSVCDDDNTCCKTREGVWACCPLPSAVCCNDGVHCCPRDTKCDLVRKTCVSYTGHRSPMFGKGAREISINPDKNRIRLNCLNGTQCTNRADAACCPYANAVCCSDGKHCCPSQTKCDESTGHCISLSSSVSQTGQMNKLTKNRISTVTVDQNELGTAVNTICPGGKFECGKNSTCCATTTNGNGWSCCPIANAICCGDGLHCCPSGTVCDSSRRGCTPKTVEHNNKPIQLHSTTLSNHMCPDKISYCADNATCCQMHDAAWGCCSLSDAICCADKLHCCPKGTVCKLEKFECVKPNNKRPNLSIIKAYELTKPDGNSLFTSRPPVIPTSDNADTTVTWCGNCGSTWGCCPTVDRDSWSCCPYVGGVCCKDNKTCCPKHSICLNNGQCMQFNDKLVKYNAPRLVPATIHSKSQSLNQFSNILFSGGVSHARKATRAQHNILLRFTDYRALKQIRHTVCPDALRYCLKSEQCCYSKQYGYTCAPKSATCCCARKDTYCPYSSVCYYGGNLCV